MQREIVQLTDKSEVVRLLELQRLLIPVPQQPAFGVPQQSLLFAFRLRLDVVGNHRRHTETVSELLDTVEVSLSGVRAGCLWLSNSCFSCIHFQ